MYQETTRVRSVSVRVVSGFSQHWALRALSRLTFSTPAPLGCNVLTVRKSSKQSALANKNGRHGTTRSRCYTLAM